MGTAPPLTLGIEEEFQIIDPETRNLSANVNKLLQQDKESSNPVDLKPEFLQSQVEIGSVVCQNVQEIRQELVRLRGEVCAMARRNNLRIAAASTHPFARWDEQYITDGVRYKEMLDNMQGVARQLLIFGCHVHVGFGHHENPENRDVMIDVMNQVRYFIPHILALSTSSPFWHGKATGLKSYRSVIFEMLPRTGIPPRFDSWSDFNAYEKTMAKVGSFGKDDPVAKIWWDIRPHPKFDTLEFRITDVCTTIDEAVCITALFQAICAKMLKLREQNMSWRVYGNLFISENKWRAVRFGTSDHMIDFGRSEEIPYRQLATELLDLIDDVVDDLGCRKEVEYIHTILEKGTSADRQLRVYQEHGGDANSAEALKAVVDHLIAETELGL